MKKKIPLLILTMAVFGSLLFFACSKSEGEGISPTYKEEGTTTGGNPYASTAGSQTSTT